MSYQVEPKIGEILKISGKFYKCMADDSCSGYPCDNCRLQNSTNCLLINCIGSEREDRQAVYLKEVKLEDEFSAEFSAFCKDCCDERKCLKHHVFRQQLEKDKVIIVEEVKA